MSRSYRRMIIAWLGFAPVLLFGCKKADEPAPKATASQVATAEPTIPQEAKKTASPVEPAETVTTPLPETSNTAAAETPGEAPADAATPETPAEVVPNDRTKMLAEVLQHYMKGMTKLRKKETEEGYREFADAGRLAGELKREFPELTSRERAICAQVLYKQACALAKQDQVDEAFTALQDAVDAGFDNFAQIDEDEDLESLRARSEFAQRRNAWETLANELAAVEVRRELKEFESYPFDFTLPDLDANDVNLADFKGKLVIVDIWGTWCPPCRDEIPSFVKLQAKFGEQGLQIIGLNYEHSKDTEKTVALIRNFIEEQSINYPCLIGDEETKKQVPEFLGFPTTLFIDRTGKVRLQFVGLHSYGKLEAAVQALLGEAET